MIIDYDLIDEYLADRLSEGRLETFEIELLNDSQLQDAVLIQRALKEGLIGQNSEAFKKQGLVVSTNNLLTSRTWAYAATLFLGLSLGYHWLEGSGSPELAPIDRIIYLETVRGTTKAQYSINGSERNLLVVDINPLSTGPYQATLYLENKVLSRQVFAKAANYSLNIIVPPLAAGTYTLLISDEENISKFDFEATSTP